MMTVVLVLAITTECLNSGSITPGYCTKQHEYTNLPTNKYQKKITTVIFTVMTAMMTTMI